MNSNETFAVLQHVAKKTNEHITRDLLEAIKIINAEYQQIDWEDQAFLNRVLTDVLSSFEIKGGSYANS
jgi:hypothetical protein